ncbi:Histone-lysine N-methyltransferase PRDM9 [Channa argus]|uniref:Histone-lysine N-methyltransferase PRDM9 n=1 Tax=Channa argus TaxID=215402 RepID=A0A6G1PP32_CHAAH|nr:Histone-lysine N-methyltransferase PRDM9 [Channa argus]
MSIEYTIDIQLTELGFPDILQPQETSVSQTRRHSASNGSFSRSHSPASLSASRKQGLLVRGQQSVDGEEGGSTKQTLKSQQTTADSHLPEPVTQKPLNLLQSLQDEDAVKESELSEVTIDTPTTGPEPTGSPQLRTEKGKDGQEDVGDGDLAHEGSAELQQDVEDDSGDSEVSEVYEEEEVEEDEAEEELDNESGHAGDYICSVCDLQLPSKFKLQDHMNLHTGARPYCCAECGKRFCQIYNYRVHLRTHAQAKVDRLRCRICRKAFASQDALTDHLSRTHFENEFYECDQCKRVFTSLKACEYHVQLHKCMLDVVCEICGRNFSSLKSLARHQKKMCYRNFKCTDCSKIFTKKNALLRHSFSHLGLLPYTCIRCRCHFRLAKLYRQHKCEPQRIHCVACLREFLNQEDFQQHKKDTGCWGNQEPKGDEIRCLECGQRFGTKEELKKHAGAHQRVLKCAECGKGFRSALLLMSHMGGHAGQSPCLCQSCGLGFPHQQNYDSHLKTCGQTPQPASAPRKRQASKSPSSKTQKITAKPESASPEIPVTSPSFVLNKRAPPVENSVSPEPVTESVSTASGQSDGLWKLTLDKQPPPGVNLVLFLPVCPSQTNDPTVPSGIPQTLQVSTMQVQPKVAISPVSSNGHLRENPPFGQPVNTPLDLSTGLKQDPECEAPLDLSKKCNSSVSALNDIPVLSIKSEPGEFEISGKYNGNRRLAGFKTTPGGANTEVKMLKMDPMDLTIHNTATNGKIMDIKKEPHSPGSDLDLWSSESFQLTGRSLEKEVKLEVNVSQPACPEMEK